MSVSEDIEELRTVPEQTQEDIKYIWVQGGKRSGEVVVEEMGGEEVRIVSVGEGCE